MGNVKNLRNAKCGRAARIYKDNWLSEVAVSSFAEQIQKVEGKYDTFGGRSHF